AVSTDGGKTFSAARQIAEVWGYVSTAFYQGDYYIFYKQGTEQKQELAVAISRDNGATWTTSLVSGNTSLSFDIEKAPGVNLAPNGKIDVIYYGHGPDVPNCSDVAAFRQRFQNGYVDQCNYNAYFTFSQDGGQTFSTPVILNQKPIMGSHFMRIAGTSRAGDYIGMASTNDFAHPIWIDTDGDDGTHVYTLQIKR
ncbi:MAG TPA: sialidase family protein, partial [Longilinea sp.]|nr:sialidase family protein [Longilinea sp.]